MRYLKDLPILIPIVGIISGTVCHCVDKIQDTKAKLPPPVLCQTEKQAPMQLPPISTAEWSRMSIEARESYTKLILIQRDIEKGRL